MLLYNRAGTGVQDPRGLEDQSAGRGEIAPPVNKETNNSEREPASRIRAAWKIRAPRAEKKTISPARVQLLNEHKE